MIIRHRLVESFLELIAIDGPPRRERAVADRVLEELRRMGLDAWEDEAATAVGGNSGNVLAKIPATVAHAPVLLLNAHLDTVQPTEGIKPVISGDLIKSDGRTILGADDRAGIALILEAVRSLLEEATPHGEIILAFTICEEVGLLGAQYLAEKGLKAAAGFVLDGGDCEGRRIVIAGPYHVRFRATVHGKATHAGTHPEDGVSAIVIASRAIANMKLGRVDEETTANIGRISGGVADNIVPELVEVYGEARSLDEAKLLLQVAHMAEQIRHAATNLGGSVEVHEVMNYRGFRLKEDDPPLRLALKAMRTLGIEPVLESITGGTDANMFNIGGIPAVALPTGMGGAHSREEYCHVPVMERCALLVQTILEEAAKSTA